MTAETITPPVSSDIAENQIADGQDPTVTYRYVDMATGTELPAESVTWDEPELSDGAVLHTTSDDGHKQHYTVHNMQGDDHVTVYVEIAKNRAWKMLVLAAILGACWYATDFILNIIF